MTLDHIIAALAVWSGVAFILTGSWAAFKARDNRCRQSKPEQLRGGVDAVSHDTPNTFREQYDHGA